MKLFLSLFYCLLVLQIFSQKISVNELKGYEWIVYNKHVGDSSEIFSSDTLLLAKSYELETFEQVTGEDNQKIDELYPRNWRLDLGMNEFDTSAQINEFYFFFIDLRKAAMRRSMEVDSITYQWLFQDPNAFTSEKSPVLLELVQMQIGDVIRIVDSLHNQSFYIEKTKSKLHVSKTLRRRYILNPKGINYGFWTFSKRKQLITFSSDTGEIHFHFRVERIDKVRMRLIPTTGAQ